MIQNTTDYIDQIDEQIEKTILSIQNIKLEKDSQLDSLQNKIVEIQHDIGQILQQNKQYVTDLQMLNDSRSNIDQITCIIEIALKFKTYIQQIDINQLQQYNQQTNSIKLYIFVQLIENIIEPLKDSDQIRQSYQQLLNIKNQIKESYDIQKLNDLDHLKDPFTFWSWCKSLLLLNLIDYGIDKQLLDQIGNKICQVQFTELIDQKIISIQGITQKLIMFLKLNQAYIQEMEQQINQCIKDQQDQINIIFDTYYQKQVKQTQKQIDILNYLLNYIKEKIQIKLEWIQTDDTIIIQENIKEAEDLAVKFGFIFDSAQQKFSEAKSNIINQINNEVKQLFQTQIIDQLIQKSGQKQWLYNSNNLFKFIQDKFLTIIQNVNKYPKQLSQEQTQSIYQLIKQQIIQDLIPLIYNLLDLQVFMSKSVKQYTKGVKQQHYKFMDIYKQQIQNIFSCNSFQTQCMIVIDQQSQQNLDVTNFGIQLCQISKIFQQFLEQLLVQLNKLNIEEKIQDQDLEYEDAFINYKYAVEQFLCQVIVGQYISIVFYSQNQSQQLVDVGNDLFKKQLDIVTEQLEQLYNEFELQELTYQIMDTLVNNIGGILISKNYTRQKDINQLQYLQKQLKQILANEEYKDLSDKIQIALQVILLSLQGTKITQEEFQKLTQTDLSQQLQYSELI